MKVTYLGWIKRKRDSKNIIFIDLSIQERELKLIIDKDQVVLSNFSEFKDLNIECYIHIEGNEYYNFKRGQNEVKVKLIELISLSETVHYPKFRDDKVNIFDEKFVNISLTDRHLYIRNPRIIRVVKFRHKLLSIIRQWFEANNFIEIPAPIITPLSLYDSSTAIPVNIHGQSMFLSQCAGFYLESSVMALGRVYNIGPSFRNESSRSKRHLLEYWHVKGEAISLSLEGMIKLTESLIIYIVENLRAETANASNLYLPNELPRLTYREAIKVLESKGLKVAFGKNFGQKEEKILSENFSSPFWIMYNSRQGEPFPYKIKPDDDQVTMTADLIASNGYGELLGVAEKIEDLSELDERLREKGKKDDLRYEWIRDIRRFGCAPHSAFGMGLERLIRWMLALSHVRDAHPFPRIFGRNIDI